MSDFGDAVGSAMDGIGDAIGSAMDGIGGAIGSAMDGVGDAFGAAMGGIGGSFSDVFGGKQQQTAMSSIVNSISKQAMKSVGGGPLGDAIGGLLEGGSIKSAIDGFFNGMSGLGGIFSDVFSGKQQQTAMSSIINSISEQTMKSVGVGPVAGALGSLLEGGSIKSAIDGFFNGMGGLGGIFSDVFGGKQQQTAMFSIINSISEQTMKSASKS